MASERESDRGHRTHPVPTRGWPSVLATCILALLFLHLGLQFDRYATGWFPAEVQATFDVDIEQSVPSWFSGAQLLVAAGLAWMLGRAGRRTTQLDARAWTGIAAVLVFASLDEIAGFHETFNTMFAMSWTVPFGLLALIVAVTFLPFVRRLPAPTRNRVFLAGALYLAGAIVVELVATQLFGQARTKDQFGYALITMLEEGLEMFGVWVLILGLIEHADRSGIRLAVQGPAAEPEAVAGNADRRPAA